jgi:hypothetical protein
MWEANVKTWLAISVVLAASAAITVVADGPAIEGKKTEKEKGGFRGE